MPVWTDKLEAAVAASGLKNGERVSVHHHLRLGDLLVQLLMPVLTAMGFKDLTLCASSLMGSACEAVLEAVKAGTISNIETTGLKNPLAVAVNKGELPNPVVFRTHGGRAKAIISGRTPISVAFLAVSATDHNGNANGVDGPNRFGSLGYGLVDAEYARHVILITDHISETPLDHVSIPPKQTDQIVRVEAIGDRSRIAGGSLRNSSRPLEHLIARRAVEVLDACKAIHEGFNFQAGSGGISLLAARKTAELMRTRSITGGFASGGATAALTELLEEGLFKELYDVQSFDDTATISLKKQSTHHEMDASLYANPDNSECMAHKLDVMLLSATEVDCQFNVNSLTGSDGRILGALGGAPDTAAGASLTMVVLPSFRGRIPTIRERVHTICTPGDTVDLFVTERGICVNPRREDLISTLESASVKLLSPEHIMGRVRKITGTPVYPEKGTKTVGIIESREGKILDRICSR